MIHANDRLARAVPAHTHCESLLYRDQRMNPGTRVQMKNHRTSTVGPSSRARDSSVISPALPKITSFTCTGMLLSVNIEIQRPAAPPISSDTPIVKGVVITSSPTRKTEAYARRLVNDAVNSAMVVA